MILHDMIFAVGLNIVQFSVANEDMLGFDDHNTTGLSNDITFEYLSSILPFLFIFALMYFVFLDFAGSRYK
ncbi:MAG TPA: hypothetical protein VLE21_00370 [Candidatus Nitrosocosmicus sp.]|nr:hypothetical protein [Candidatus Nitrosocosmicus sp.]